MPLAENFDMIVIETWKLKWIAKTMNIEWTRKHEQKMSTEKRQLESNKSEQIGSGQKSQRSFRSLKRKALSFTIYLNLSAYVMTAAL